MTYPKLKPCPKCGTAGAELIVYTYDHGGRHVECDECNYLGPCAGNRLDAIRLHNQQYEKLLPSNENEIRPVPTRRG